MADTLKDCALGNDTSQFGYSADGKQKPNFELLKQLCSFIAVRAGISWGYIDKWFQYSWTNLLGHNRVAYHVPYFGENPITQMDHFFRIVNPIETDKLVLDCELAHNNSRYQITLVTNKCLEICKRRMGVYPIVYTRANWTNEHLQVSDLPILDWWLAQYWTTLKYPAFTPEQLTLPDLPKGVSKWLIKQTADHASGKAIGLAAYYGQRDRWNGGIEAVDKYFGRQIELPLSYEEKVDRLVELHKEHFIEGEI